MKLLSFNVNGIRAVLKKGFTDFIAKAKPDILCIQETKAHPEQVNLELPGYMQYWNAATRPGYSGTATFTKIEPLRHTKGMGIIEHDNEGRVLTLEYE